MIMTGLFVNSGKNRMRDLLDADLNHGQLGTDDTAALYSDTALLAAVAATSIDVTTTTSDKQIVADYNLSSATAQGSTFTEYGLFNSSNTMFARFVFSSLVHESTEQWQLSTRLFID